MHSSVGNSKRVPMRSDRCSRASNSYRCRRPVSTAQDADTGGAHLEAEEEHLGQAREHRALRDRLAARRLDLRLARERVQRVQQRPVPHGQVLARV
jgi:hypothetical protein